jgi:hypothetical protein
MPGEDLFPGSQMVPSVYPHMVEGMSGLSGVSSLRVLIEFHPADLITCQRPHLLIPSPWGLGFHHVDLEEHRHSDQSSSYLIKECEVLITPTAYLSHGNMAVLVSCCQQVSL